MAQKRRPKTTRDPVRASRRRETPAFQPPESERPHRFSSFILRGICASRNPSPVLQTHDEVKLDPKAEFTPQAARDGLRTEEVPVRSDDLVEIECSDGGFLWMRAEDYRSHLSTGARTGGDGNVVEVSPDLQLLPQGLQARGPVSWAVKSLKVFGIDLPAKAAQTLAQRLDSRAFVPAGDMRRRPPPGLYRCRSATEGFALQPMDMKDIRPDAPCLLLIHGTASSTWSSFGDLWNKDRRIELETLHKAYGSCMFAFEHSTLTRSPIENALQLAEALVKLPKGTRLHLMTHSGGGLVGELMCRSGAAKQPLTAGDDKKPPPAGAPFSPDEHGLLERSREKYAGQAAVLKKLETVLRELARRRITFERFVRIACPARGTRLASGRLDRWLSVFGSIAGTARPGTPLADMFKDIGDLLALAIKHPTDFPALPGLEAMMPDSVFMQLVNWPSACVRGDLMVIAGDIDSNAWWARLLVWPTGRFYEGDHDLIVNTRSMLGGAKRVGRSGVSFHKGPEVNHFRYFQNPDSAGRIVQALTLAAGDLSGFEPLRKEPVDIARAMVPRSAEPRPVVFVLPGIMGSELAVGGNMVWLDIPDIAFGGFAQLRIDAEDVVAVRPFARYYGRIIEFMAQTHKVVPFAFDWRLPVEQEADRLAVAVEREFDLARPHGQPVRILAHSMGGLVARAMISRHEQLWRDICSVPGARLVMLGTPNGGSHAITELLVARASVLRQLSRIDVQRSPRDLLEIIARFPGVIAMLPKDGREDYFSLETWKTYHDGKTGEGWVLPEEKDLERAREFRKLLDGALVDPAHMLYVAGCSDMTITGMHLDPAGQKIVFEATTRGDGRVTWDSGIPPGVPAWYMQDVEHGGLPAHEAAFEAIEELLRQGATSRLPQSPPVSRAAEATFPLPEADDELFPDEDDLAAAALGAASRKRMRQRRGERPVQVRVVHGNLAYAGHPVAVGHYAGDAIVSAEKHLDLALSSALSRRHQIGIYPGEIGTHAVFINPRLAYNPTAVPKGAIVVGLGTAGSLTAAALTRSARRALLEYAVQWMDFGPKAAGADSGGDRAELGVSALLVGTGAGGITVEDSVYAWLQAVNDANKALASTRITQRICQVEFIELYEDRAIQAVDALRMLQDRTPLRDSFAFVDELDVRKGGLSRVSYEEPGGWWHRLHVLGERREGAPADGSLRFSSSTRRARSEVRLLAPQRILVDEFIQQSIRTTRDNRLAARTLFELLLPNEIKDQAPEGGDTIFIVDEEAARYPWELLDDRFSRGERDKPLFVSHGILRQLESVEFRERVQGVVDNTALVIGDPLSTYPELKGAQAEARIVHRALQGDGRFRVEFRERPSSQQVINALYAGDYKVLHLAGHGVYRLPPKGAATCAACRQPLPREAVDGHAASMEPLTGMVIGDGVVLSPKEAHQMRAVPELVFVNCCHLGRIEPGDQRPLDERNERNDYNRIAANLATEYIRMGVRAVVAAGWAVDDSAALTFATVFYDQMLKGGAFGEAVKKAREETFERHPETNTWGAYQCYGDPDYHLIKENNALADEETLKWGTPSQAVAELNNLTARLATSASGGAGSEKKRLKAIAARLKEKKWLVDGRVCAALGRAFGEAKLFEKAIPYYQRALEAENAQATLKDIEQLANIESRHAVCLSSRGRPKDALAAVNRSISRLTAIQGRGLIGEPAKGETVERLSALGSAHKRKALISPSDRSKSLEQMRDYYKKASDRALSKTKQVDPYPLSNWLTAELTLAWQSEGRRIPPKEMQIFKKGLSDCRLELESAWRKRPDVWIRIGLCDLDLLEVLAEESLDDQTAARILQSYQEARKLASPREFESVLDQFDFLEEMSTGNTRLAKKLHALRREIDNKPGREKAKPA